jgi:hypothetical protein
LGSYFLFLLLPWLTPEPNVLAPAEHGLFQNYGFDQNDSEKFAPILKLLHDGAYKIEEVDVDGFGKDTSIFKLYYSKDSVVIEEFSVHRSIQHLRSIDKYSVNGKLLREEFYSNQKLNSWKYYDSDGSWVEYKHLVPSNRNHWLDSTILIKKITFDKYERPLEEGEYDEYEEFGDNRKIARKTVYRYHGNMTEKSEFVKYDWARWISKNYVKEARSLSVTYLLKKNELKKIDTLRHSITIETTDYSSYDSDVYFDKYYDTITYDKDCHSINQNKETALNGGSIIFRTYINYSRDNNGLLISQTTRSPADSYKYTDEWEYDKAGNCIRHGTNTWTYDAKGNLIEFDYAYKNTFKIFYK